LPAPNRSGTNDDPALIEANVAAMTQAALDLFRLGHLPVMGEWFALPLIEAAGSTAIGDDVFPWGSKTRSPSPDVLSWRLGSVGDSRPLEVAFTSSSSSRSSAQA
jgi:hypothetical protein